MTLIPWWKGLNKYLLNLIRHIKMSWQSFYPLLKGAIIDALYSCSAVFDIFSAPNC
ncbi:hypothetical protein BCL69_10814 [Nitrosomonas communis]|uniref:Uncharacterized protein n=1 Tax=Nitrosomonas communis TaxID=44574 RepID=A0A1H2ZGE8_9PROT|nr:hypothetical protein BCL69_10814 [Nitrosomonas communis]SDX16048.1 hypothetical protein SAMN05421882_10748 [Nitrosomonas communis]